MPYKVQKKGNSYIVVKKDGEVIAGNKTKLSKERAIKTMKAIYANEG